jgi:hypothetical protein
MPNRTFQPVTDETLPDPILQPLQWQRAMIARLDEQDPLPALAPVQPENAEPISIPGEVKTHLHELRSARDFVQLEALDIPQTGFIIRLDDEIDSSRFHMTTRRYTSSFYAPTQIENMTMLSFSSLIMDLLTTLFKAALLSVLDLSANYELQMSILHPDLSIAVDSGLAPLTPSSKAEILGSLLDQIVSYLQSGSPRSSFGKLQVIVTVAKKNHNFEGEGAPFLEDDCYSKRKSRTQSTGSGMYFLTLNLSYLETRSFYSMFQFYT